MKKRAYTFREIDSLLIIFIATTLLLLLPHILNTLSKKPALIGEEPYYHYRMAEDIVNEGTVKYDYLSYGGRQHIFNLYHYILAGSFYIFGKSAAVKFFPLILGILSVLLLYKILQKFRLDPSYRFFLVIVFISAPVFMYTFVLLNSSSVVFLLALLGFLLLLQRGKFYFILSVSILISTIFFSFANILTIILFLFIYSTINENHPKEFFSNPKKKAALTTLVLFLVSFLYYFSFYLKHRLPENITFIDRNIFRIFISDLGGSGFSPFVVLLSVAGLVLTWGNKRKIWPLYLGVLFLIITAFYTESVLIYLNVAVSAFATYAFVRLVNRKWELTLLKKLTIFILFLGILFSIISYTTRISNTPPGMNVVESLEWLNKNSEQGVVLSHYSKGFWIEAIADKKVLMDGYFSYAPNPNLRFTDSKKIFESRNLDKTKSLLNKYDVSYIWIDAEMKTGLVWTKEQQGLLFLFRNNETFNNIYNNTGVEIWQVRK